MSVKDYVNAVRVETIPTDKSKLSKKGKTKRNNELDAYVAEANRLGISYGRLSAIMAEAGETVHEKWSSKQSRVGYNATDWAKVQLLRDYGY